MSKFEIGEIAVINSKLYQGWYGKEVEIMSVFTFLGRTAYHTFPDDENGTGWFEEALRKRRPPQELTTWEEVQEITGWNPTKQVVQHDQN